MNQINHEQNRFFRRTACGYGFHRTHAIRKANSLGREPRPTFYRRHSRTPVSDR